jgi:DNA invertase Pin-like site-specific DNA recombinase
MLGPVGQWEREAIGERTRDVLRHKRSCGERVGNIHYGYRLSADGKHVEPDAAEQAVLVTIRDLRARHRSLREIAAVLNASGALTRRGTAWRHEYVKNVIAK